MLLDLKYTTLFLLVITSFIAFVTSDDGLNYCTYVWPQEIARGQCPKRAPNSGPMLQPNLPILGGVYCYNNGSGMCKGFAGRFEFYFNTFNDKMLGPVESSEFVDGNGYHARVPVNYDINGTITYADRSINWASSFVKAQSGKRFSLLSMENFNWCAYTEKNYWPYKSAIKDPTGRYHIYFFNRQSCIYDTQHSNDESGWQHYNTRFLHNSSIRIDLDMNPLIFALEDHLAASGTSKLRLVKNKRQHWYEVEFEVLKKPTKSADYFVKMNQFDTPPCVINGTSSILSKNAYTKFTDKCLDDTYHFRDGTTNARLVTSCCGTEQVEIADIPKVLYNVQRNRSVIIEADLHNLPRRPPKTQEKFYGMTANSDDEWKIFAKDGFVLSATTTIPIQNSTNEVKVISLFAEFNDKPKDTYDEYYPRPYISKYIAKLILNENRPDDSDWKFDRQSTKVEVKNLNYVDDIAYLYGCDKILVILGPLYNEVGVDDFKLETKAPLGSIADLGIYELANAFFAMPDDSKTLWVYHRTNFMTDLQYTCSSESKGIVTAQRKSGKYYPRHGINSPQFMVIYSPIKGTSEETFFKILDVYKGSLDSPEAPDPSRYPLPDGDPYGPIFVNNLWIYILIGIGLILILAMCVTCVLTIRRRKLRRKHQNGPRSVATVRSNMPKSGMSSYPTNRSKFNPSSIRSQATNRSSNISSGVGRPSRTSQRPSRLGRRPSSSASSKRSTSLGSKASGATMRSKASSLARRPPSSSSRMSSGSRRSQK